MAKVVRWEGAAERLKPGYCLTLLSEATRKFLGKRPADGQRLAGTRQKAPQGRRGAFEARLLNVVLCEAIRKPVGKDPADGQSLALGSRNAAKGAGKGTAERLKPG